MARQDTLTFDKTEIELFYISGKNPARYNWTYEKIISVQLDHGEMPYLFFLKKPSDRIVFQIRGMEEPLVLYSLRIDKFGEYCDSLRKFCKENRITMRDYL